jgi:large subunit ribosomal protein L21
VIFLLTEFVAKGYNPRLMNSYAIIQTGGKQYRVAEGETLKVEKLEAKAGEEVKIDDVIFAKTEQKSFTGRPKISGASVTAEVIRQFRAPKILVYKERQKKVYKKTQGHRQWLTELRIKSISLP